MTRRRQSRAFREEGRGGGKVCFFLMCLVGSVRSFVYFGERERIWSRDHPEIKGL